MTLKEWALSYAGQGWKVFPLLPKDKKPATPQGFKNASNDPEQVEAWWDKNPNYNIGIATGRESGLLVIDLDVDEDKGLNGYDTLREWQREHKELPETWQSITGRGGYHLFYRDNGLNQSRVNLYEGVDIRGNGGYIVAPPSIHPNGKRYEWEIGPGDGEVAAINNIVMEFLKGNEPEHQENFSTPNTIPVGERNSTLYKLACSMRARGDAEEAIRAAVKATNDVRCIPPLDDKEVDMIINSAMKQKSGTAPYKSTCDNRGARPIKIYNFHLDKASDVVIKTPEWLIPGYIPKYGITTIAGEGGVGKTSLWCSIAASVTTGKPSFLLGGDESFKKEPETVVVFSAEDSWNYVLKQRLSNNGADMDKILFMGPEDERFVDLNVNSDLLKGIIEANKPSLIIFDPVQAFVPENFRMGDRNAMRKCFSPLIGFGETYKTTSIVIAHANKQNNVWGRKRIADSSDIWDASRSVLMTGNVPNNNNLRYISHEKSNWGKLQQSVMFELNEGMPFFKSYSNKKDREFVLEDSKNINGNSASDTAKDFILDLLNEHKQMEIAELDELAAATGISKNALKNAKAELRQEQLIHTWSIGYGKDKKFLITLKAT